MGKISNPHDKYVKETLSKKENAVDFLKNYLPNEILEIVNLDKLEIEKDSYVTEELQEYFTDLLYKVNIHKKESYIYFLFEHKSYPEKLIGIQLLEYLLQCWKAKIKQKEKLPIILPIVIYHGKPKWNIGMKFSDILEIEDERLKKYIPDFEYILYDLTKYRDENILGTENLKIMMQLLKYIYSDELLKKLPNILKLLLKDGKIDVNTLKTITIYLLSTTEIKLEDFIKLIEENVSKKGGEFSMSTLQRMMNESMEEGIQQGMERGIERGRREERKALAKRMLRKGLDIEMILEMTGLSREDITK
ncbi:MAG: hypothetical protein B6I28_04670 [Fusobacteriia bacterium 4572_132]|nr:MAG: hypothetical protein B6I28_04670 [Fusobacteriia bacterium 4572_132]